MEMSNINLWAVAFVLIIAPLLCAIVILARYYFYGPDDIDQSTVANNATAQGGRVDENTQNR